jgi:hypothetical protein
MMSTHAWSCGGSAPQTSSVTSRLRTLQRAIQIVLAGYLVTLLVAAPAACLWLASQEGVPFLRQAGLAGNEDAEIAGLLLAFGGAVLGHLLVLVGQWLCLFHSPQSRGAKDLAYVCVLLVCCVAPVNAAALLVGEAGDLPWLGRLIHHPLAGTTWDKVPTGTLLQVVGVLLLLGNILVFTQYLRALLLRAHQEKRVRRIEAFYFFVCLVVGISFGAGTAPEAVRSSALVLQGVVLAWLLVLGGHAWLILGACGCAGAILGAPAPGARGLWGEGGESQRAASGCWIPLKTTGQ